jgi:lysophospholipase L1-like esterase
MRTGVIVVICCFLALGLRPERARAEGGEPLATFFERLAGLESRRDGAIARIAWYGDSAIVADGYTSELRKRLQRRFGDAGPGFLLASATFDGYLRDGVRMKRQGWEASSVMSGGLDGGRYGYGGVVATSWGGASATFELKGEPVGIVEVWYQAIPKGGKLQLFVDDAAEPLATRSTGRKPGGDAVWRVALEKPAKSLKIRAAGEGQVRVYGVVLERADRGVQLDALGILGMRARRWLNADERHLEEQVEARGVSLVVLSFGGNERVDPSLSEAAHAADLLKTLAALRAGAPEAACVIVAPIAHGREDGGKIVLDPALTKIYNAQRALAAAEGCAYFDTLAAMGGTKALTTWREKKQLSGDYAHLTKKGHEALGTLISDWLLERYDAWKKKSRS